MARHGWAVDIHPLPPLLHNRPERIAGEVERLVGELSERYDRVAVGYADCGTYGALDAVCQRLGVQRLPGLHCYDLFAGPATVQGLTDDEPGTYLLTDFLVRSFSRTVIQELGLDRHPELRDEYFRYYTRVVWLVQTTVPEEIAELRTLAQEAAERIGLPLQVRQTGPRGLDAALKTLLTRDPWDDIKAPLGGLPVDPGDSRDTGRLPSPAGARGMSRSRRR